MKSDFEYGPDSLAIPPEDPVARERALQHALMALRNRASDEAPGDFFQHWLKVFVLPAMALVLMLAWAMWPGGATDEATADLQVLNEVAELFPNTLDAVVEQDGRVDVQLTGNEVPASEQPLVVVLRKGREVLRVLSYSGREVCLNLSGRKVCVEVLTDDEGQVIIAGDNYLWSEQNPYLLNGYHVEARSLGVTL